MVAVFWMTSRSTKVDLGFSEHLVLLLQISCFFRTKLASKKRKLACSKLSDAKIKMMKNSWLLIECIPLPFFPKPLPLTLQSSSAIWSYLGSLFSVEVGWLSMSYPASGRTSIHALSNIQNAKQRRHRLPCLLQVLEHLNVLLLQRKIVSASVRAKNNSVVSSPYNLGFSFSKKEKDVLFQSQLNCWSGKVKKNKGNILKAFQISSQISRICRNPSGTGTHIIWKHPSCSRVNFSTKVIRVHPKFHRFEAWKKPVEHW